MDDDELAAALDGEAAEITDIDRIDPVPDTLTLKCGIEVHVLDMRTRQLFKLLRIITHGAGTAFMQAGLDFNEDPAEFMKKLVTLVLFSIPDAEQETIDFLQSMLEPVGLCAKAPRDMSAKEREGNLALWTELNQELWNPDPEDTICLVENFVRRESSDMQALGKRLSQFLQLAAKTGQLKDKSGDARPSQDLKLPESSPASSTSSQPSTGGRTKPSSTSPSNGSGKSSPRSRQGTGRRSAAAAR
jgi:hypothetical protein